MQVRQTQNNAIINFIKPLNHIKNACLKITFRQALLINKSLSQLYDL
ncbi:hypothetical protein HMPREF9370_1963 [Neisseria wadsworthii 9715]|uniref:Uncharacterized protein n=1 Tax=Neisseria wadsworthii 9715 TaxID=1030841 RepID=G4CSA3_9NEIS|nr:hypothetical protein HMPREF9370_1963 [Neisseria wadsworthii 9715]